MDIQFLIVGDLCGELEGVVRDADLLGAAADGANDGHHCCEY